MILNGCLIGVSACMYRTVSSREIEEARIKDPLVRAASSLRPAEFNKVSLVTIISPIKSNLPHPILARLPHPLSTFFFFISLTRVLRSGTCNLDDVNNIASFSGALLRYFMIYAFILNNALLR